MLKNVMSKVKGFVSNNKGLVRLSAILSAVFSSAFCASIFTFAADGDADTAISNALTSGVNSISTNVLNYIAMLLPSCLGVFGMILAVGIGVKFIKKIMK